MFLLEQMALEKQQSLRLLDLLCAAMTDRVDNASMQRKGIRLSVPGLIMSGILRFKEKSTNHQF